MKKVLLVVIASSLLLSGCITDIVTVPLGIAYDVTKVAVKGTAAVVGGTVDLLTPDSKDKKDDDKKDTSKSDATS
ncbi:NF038104 family lipoprotein [Aquirhabdus sp.]|uniref:NF038104 family lipoprotein n=1 Tax=Aquirhabdus sp. TaxID=2824160 RepID=UPI00396CA82B